MNINTSLGHFVCAFKSTCMFLPLLVLIVVYSVNVCSNELVISDDLNDRLVLNKPVRRVISLAPHVTENLFAIGAGDRIVGTVEYSDYPEAAKHIPRVGNYSAVSIEAIIQLKPDLVLAWQAGISAAALKKLRALGIPVYVDNVSSVNDIARTLRTYGRILDLTDEAEHVAHKFETDISQLRSKYLARKKVRVFYQVWHSPIQTLNGRSLIGEVIRLCGGRNVFSEAKSVAPLVSVESVIAENPQLIVASGIGNERPAWLNDWLKYPVIDAVAHNQLVHIHPDILQRHTPRILFGAAEMCSAIDAAR